LSELRNDLDTIDEQMRFLVEAGKGDSTEYASLNEARGKLVNQIIDKKSQTREEKEFFEKAIEKILSEAEIICCTLNSSGSEKLDRYYHNIEAIIVDEAAQCTEPSNIIPLRFKANKLILIGDPKQLPATTFNEQNSVTKYNRSLFEVGAVYTEIP
jgi:senataxin